jgi:hypothetical protein
MVCLREGDVENEGENAEARRIAAVKQVLDRSNVVTLTNIGDAVLEELGVTPEQACTEVDLNRTVRDRIICVVMEHAKEAAGLCNVDEISEEKQLKVLNLIAMELGDDVTVPPMLARSHTLDENFSVETSNRFEVIDGFADGITKKVDETAAFTLIHCTGEHFHVSGAKKAYARHIATKHEGPLTETETKAGMWQCATCGKVTYTTERSAKSHQTDCANRTTEEHWQAKRRKAVKGTRVARVKQANRKWQPNFGKTKHAQLNLDLNDRITDAQIKAFFGPMSLNSPKFSSMTGKTIRQIPREAQHALGQRCVQLLLSAFCQIVGTKNYAMLFLSLPRLCLQFPSREKQKAGTSTASQALERTSAVLGGDFRSFEIEQDERGSCSLCTNAGRQRSVWTNPGRNHTHRKGTNRERRVQGRCLRNS